MADRWNLLFIMPDQLRLDFLSCYGATFIETPHIDSLAAHGLRYEYAYSAHPVCVPARVSLITGMTAIKTGVLDNGQFLRPDYHACGIRTWPEVLGEKDYQTAAIGKMHFYPWEKRLGFRERIIAEDKLWGYIQDDYYHFLVTHGYSKRAFVDDPVYHRNHMALVSPIPWEYTVDHYVGQETRRWIEQYDDDHPFALMVGFPGPHSPYDPAPEFADFAPDSMPEPLPAVPEDTAGMHARHSHSDSSRKPWYAVRNENPPTGETFMLQRARYAGLVKQIDHEVGCILDALRRKNLLDTTVIIFSTDHGDYLGDHGLSGKASFYEAACHIPMIVRHPKIAGPTVNRELVTLTDVTATLLALAGAELPGYLDCRPLPGLGLAEEEAREFIMGHLRDGWMLFDGRWKLAKYAGGATHLFDLENDPEEQHNLVQGSNCTEIRTRLETILATETMRLIDEAFFWQRVYTFSYSSSPDFGRAGWERTYPMSWEGIYGA